MKPLEPPASLGMLVALNARGSHIYAGTVTHKTKARRRSRDRAARLSRRANR